MLPGFSKGHLASLALLMLFPWQVCPSLYLELKAAFMSSTHEQAEGAGPTAPSCPWGVVKCRFLGPAPFNSARITHFIHCTLSIHLGEWRPKELACGAQGDTAKCPDFLIPSPVFTKLLLSLEGAAGQPL